MILVASSELSGNLIVIAFYLAVIAICLIFIWFTRTIIRHVGGFHFIPDAVLGVLQVAPAFNLILDALRSV